MQNHSFMIYLLVRRKICKIILGLNLDTKLMWKLLKEQKITLIYKFFEILCNNFWFRLPILAVLQANSFLVCDLWEHSFFWALFSLLWSELFVSSFKIISSKISLLSGKFLHQNYNFFCSRIFFFHFTSWTLVIWVIFEFLLGNIYFNGKNTQFFLRNARKTEQIWLLSFFISGYLSRYLYLDISDMDIAKPYFLSTLRNLRQFGSLKIHSSWQKLYFRCVGDSFSLYFLQKLLKTKKTSCRKLLER